MQDFWTSFVAILLEGIPFLLLGALVSGFIHQLSQPLILPFTKVKKRPHGVLAGCVMGILLPLCECSSILIVRRLLQRGVPLFVGMTYFLAGAILNPITSFTTWIAFQGRNPYEMVLGRFGGGLLLVMALGWWFSKKQTHEIFRSQNSSGSEVECQHSSKRWINALMVTKHDFLMVISFFAIGAAFSSAVNTFVSWWKIAPWLTHPWLSPLLTILSAQGMSLCSTIDAFIIAPMGEIPTHAKLAYLVAGPIFDLKLMMMYALIFKPKVVLKLWAMITSLTYTIAMVYYFCSNSF